MTGRRGLAQRVADLERRAVLRPENDPTLGDNGTPWLHDTIADPERVKEWRRSHARHD